MQKITFPKPDNQKVSSACGPFATGATLLLALQFCLLSGPTVFAQGSLTPPGAPAPTMKTLAQIEPRTPISSQPYTISSPGSYYLTTNLTGTSGQSAITISSSDVTLDLGGFSLLGTPSAQEGVLITGTNSNIVVRNGIITGWGDTAIFTGINASLSRLVIEHVVCSSNHYDGISFTYATHSVVRDCSFAYNGYDGIYSDGGDVISGCTFNGNQNAMECYGGVARNCFIMSSTNVGIYSNNGEISGCQVYSCGVQGIYAGPSALVRDCTIFSTGSSGVYITSPGCRILNNTVTSANFNSVAGNAGIYIDAADCVVDGNFVSGSGVAGIAVNSASFAGNVVIRNTVFGNGASNYVGASGNDFGPVGVAATATSPWANISH